MSIADGMEFEKQKFGTKVNLKTKVEMIDKSQIDNVKPEQKNNNEQMPIDTTSAAIAANPVLPAGMGSLNVLIGFEESQASCIEFRNLGHNAFSCDLKECSGGKPEFHLKMDIFKAIKLKKWDLIILHAPCTYTALCGNRWYWNSPLRIEGIKLCKDSFETACSVCDKVVLICYFVH